MDTTNVISLNEAKEKRKRKLKKKAKPKKRSPFELILDLFNPADEKPKPKRNYEILNFHAFPGFDKLSRHEAEVFSALISIIREFEKVRKAREAKKRDPWEAFVANPEKPKRLSFKGKQQKAWETYRELAFTLRKNLLSD